MKYFTTDFIEFFKELSANNNKEWFHSQKKRYEGSVKGPFLRFVGDLIAEIQKADSGLAIEAKDCILRINRDIRFSKDKTPYNLHVTAFISNGGRKDKSQPGLFIRFSPELTGIMGGCFGPDKNQLAAIRAAIIKQPDNLQSLIHAKAFQEKFGSIKGETMKRIPKEYREAAEKHPLILNKQFYFVAEETPNLITQNNLMDTIMAYYAAMKPVNDFLASVIK